MKWGGIVMLMYFIVVTQLNAQTNNGPRLNAMGMNGAVMSNPYLIGSNPSGPASLNNRTLAFSYAKLFVDTELSEQTMAMSVPTSKGTFGMSVQRYGTTAYHEMTISAVFAKNFGKQLSLGLKFNLHQLKIENYGASARYAAGLGLTYKPDRDFAFGISINPPAFQQDRHPITNLTMESAIAIGASYLISDRTLTAITATHILGGRTNLGLGIDYKPITAFSLRGGLTTNPFTPHFGFGYQYKKSTVDLAVSSHPYLAYTIQIGVTYAF